MARRGGFFGAGEAERESRLSQQRDYAAQLQEQVRAKHAQAEQDKARRRQEQQRERELLDAQVQAEQAQRRPPPPLTLQTDAPPPLASPSRSPLRAQASPASTHEIHHGSTLLSASPPKYSDTSAVAVDNRAAMAAVAFGSPAATVTMLVTTFTPGPSIFDSLLQAEPDRGLTNQLEALQSLRLEIEASWRQRRAAMQAIATKPQFIVVPSPKASGSIPLSMEEKRQLDQEIEIHPPEPDEQQGENQDDEEPELRSNTSGLLAESVLIPLSKASPIKRDHAPSVSPKRPIPTTTPRSNSAVHRRLAAATAAAASAYADTSPPSLGHSSALKHDSELLHFDQ